jgi:hypothetical protein
MPALPEAAQPQQRLLLRGMLPRASKGEAMSEPTGYHDMHGIPIHNGDLIRGESEGVKHAN